MRPKIISHMISSVDGRLLADRWTPPAAGVDADVLRQHYDWVAARFGADGWIVGRRTMQGYANGMARAVDATGDGLRDMYIADRKSRDVAVAIDPHGKLHYGKDNVGGDHVVAVLGEQVTDPYLAELREDGVSYLFAGADGTNLHRAMDILGGEFGIKTLLLEGGGLTNGTFLKAGLIDEISLLLYPGIDGLAGVPSIFEYAGTPDEKPALGQSLRHIGTEDLSGGTVWLRFRVERSAEIPK
jgi:5-amino-6-(5-phosphoribosylamino)uracil reductase